MKKTKALVVLSGGQDSTTCLFWALQEFDEVFAVTFDYGQTHAIELEAATKIAGMAGIAERHEIIKIGAILQGTSPLTNRDEELEQYDDMFSLPGGVEKTFVPGRNMLFLTLAANHAYVRGIDQLITGVCEEDSGGYPDCRSAFVAACEYSLRKGFDKDFKIHTPLMYLTKAETVKMAYALNGCWEALEYSHTSYDGAYPPVGKDHATLLRAKGFFEAELPDPLVVRAAREGLMELPDTVNYNTIRRFLENV